MTTNKEQALYTSKDYTEIHNRIVEEVGSILAHTKHYNFDETDCNTYYGQLSQEKYKIMRSLSIPELKKVVRLLDVAKNIQDAFGSCTSIYECATTNNIVARLLDLEDNWTIGQYVKLQLELEESSLKFDHLKRIYQRLRKLGYIDRIDKYEKVEELNLDGLDIPW